MENRRGASGAKILAFPIAFLLLMVPYIGTVVLLPLIVTYRAFTVAFLGQLEPGVGLDPETEPAAQ